MGSVPGYDISFTNDPNWADAIPTAYDPQQQDWWYDQGYYVAMPSGDAPAQSGDPALVGGGATHYPDWWWDAYYTGLPAYYDPRTGQWTPADGNWSPGIWNPATGTFDQPDWDGKGPIPVTGYVDGYGSEYDHRWDWPGWEELGLDPSSEDWWPDGGYDDSPWYERPPKPNHGTTNPWALAYQKAKRFLSDFGQMSSSGPLKRRVSRSQTLRQYRLHKPQWVDPFPWIPGTEPEKRLFELLVQRGIYFVFQGQIQEFEEGWYVTLGVPGYEPDFILPQYRIILDPWSPFHHSIADHMVVDTEKVALYEAMGYRYYHPWALADGMWSFDQVGIPHFRGNTLEMLMAIPELARAPLPITYWKDIPCIKDGYRIGQNLGAGATAVAAANKARARPRARGLVFTGRTRTQRAA